MTASYQVRLFGTNGLQTAVFDDWNSLFVSERTNGSSSHTFSIQGDDPRRSLFATDAIFEVWRSDLDMGIPWYAEYSGFHRTKQDQITDKGLPLFTSFGRSFEDLLGRREVLYPAGSSHDSKSGPVDDILKAYVDENAGPGALASGGRLRDGVTTGLSVAGNLGAGAVWSGSNAWKNLLVTLTDIVQFTNIDFWVRRTGPVTWQFSTAVPRRGTDRSGAGVAAPVTFSLAHDNMSQPFAVESRIDEVNVIVVLGGGAETNRATSIVIDAVAMAQSPWNTGEKTFDQRNLLTNAALTAAGAAQLHSLRVVPTISFEGLDTPGVAYGRDFFLGDLIMAEFRDVAKAKKLVGVDINVANGQENLVFHFADEIS